jgi:hypothetical protein
MRPVVALVLVLLVGSPAAAQDDGSGRPAHPGLMYSCMTMPPEGPPYVGEGVPYVVEHRWVGYSVSRFSRFTVPGIALFVASGRLREEGFSPLEDRALFVRAAATGTPSGHTLARLAMAVLLSRADEEPVTRRDAPHDLSRPDLIVDPVVSGGVLTFTLRVAASAPYVRQVTVDLATGIASGGS